MVNTSSRIAGLALLALLAATNANAQEMEERLSPPVAVPLDFLDWTSHDRGWLADQLGDAGAGLSLDGDVAQVGRLPTLRALNRIRAFAYLAQPGLRPPFFDLRLEGERRCITQFATSIVPGIGPDDFARPRLAATGADPGLLDQCLIRPGGDDAWRGLDRDAFRARYFDKGGVLKADFADLARDPGFLAAAIDLGFLVAQEDYSGLPRLDSE